MNGSSRHVKKTLAEYMKVNKIGIYGPKKAAKQ